MGGSISWPYSYGFGALPDAVQNTYRRYQENRRFLQLIDRIKDRKPVLQVPQM